MKSDGTLSTIFKFYKQRNIILFFYWSKLRATVGSLASDSSFHLHLIRFLSVFFSPLSFPSLLFFFPSPPPPKFAVSDESPPFFPSLAIFSSRRFRLNFFFAQLVTTLIDAGRHSILSNFLNASLAYPAIPLLESISTFKTCLYESFFYYYYSRYEKVWKWTRIEFRKGFVL